MSEITSGITANYHAIHLHYLDAPTHCIKESIAFIDPSESSAVTGVRIFSKGYQKPRRSNFTLLVAVCSIVAPQALRM